MLDWFVGAVVVAVVLVAAAFVYLKAPSTDLPGPPTVRVEIESNCV